MMAVDWTEIIATLGRSVRELRMLVGWSQQQLADRAVVSQGTISRMESKHCDRIPFHSVVAVLRTLGTATSQLHLTMSPTTRALLTFTESLAGPVRLADPDPDLAAIVLLCTQISPWQRRLFRRFVRNAAELLVASKEHPDDAQLEPLCLPATIL